MTSQRRKLWLGIEEVVGIAGITRDDVFRYIATGKLQHRRFGARVVVDAHDVADLAEARQRAQTSA